MKRVRSPQRASDSFASFTVPWYASFGARTRSPGARVRRSEWMAASPEAKQTLSAPPSRSAIAASSAVRSGFPLRL